MPSITLIYFMEKLSKTMLRVLQELVKGGPFTVSWTSPWPKRGDEHLAFSGLRVTSKTLEGLEARKLIDHILVDSAMNPVKSLYGIDIKTLSRLYRLTKAGEEMCREECLLARRL